MNQQQSHFWQVIEWKGELELEEDPDKTIEYVCPPGMNDAGQPSEGAMDMDMKSGEQEKEGQKVEEQSEGDKSTSEKTESASENAEEKDKEEEEKTEAAKEEDAGPPERPYENPMLVHLFTQCRLIERILEAWEEDDLDRAQLPASRGRCSRRGYMGHLTKVTF